MSVSSVAPTPFYQDPDRLPIGLPQASADDKAAAAKGDGKHLSMFAEGDDEPSFWDLLDVINPLQHIPVISNIYRELTGDQIGVGARLIGGTLFGGPIGLVASAVDCVVEESSGKDMGGHMLALFQDDEPAAPGATQLAQTPPAAPTPAVTAAAATEATAPVFSLPGGPVAPGAAQPMAFSLDDVPPAPAAAPMPPAPIAAPQQPVETATLAAAKPMPLVAGIGRTMPAPPRNTNVNAQPLAPVTVPVSNSGTRSNVPITGRSPQVAASVAAAQRALATSDKAGSNPMLPPTDANGQTAANPDWFTNAWGQALDKYQRANQRNDKSGTAPSTSTLQ